jgi:hypothetical protein
VSIRSKSKKAKEGSKINMKKTRKDIVILVYPPKNPLNPFDLGRLKILNREQVKHEETH